jgi:hypothetical protein
MVGHDPLADVQDALDAAKLHLLIADALHPHPRVWRPATTALVADVRTRVRRYRRIVSQRAIDAAREARPITVDHRGGTTPSFSRFHPGGWTGD